MQNTDAGGGVRRAGTRAAEDRGGGGPAKHVQRRDVRAQREDTVVLEQDHALVADLPDHIAGLLQGRIRNAGLTVEDDGEVVVHRAKGDHVSQNDHH